MAVCALTPRRNIPLFFYHAYRSDKPLKVSPHYTRDSLVVFEPDVISVELSCKPLAIHCLHLSIRTDFLVAFTTDKLKRMIKICKIDSSSVAINWDNITDKIQPRFPSKV